jgi:hypothetical protein
MDVIAVIFLLIYAIYASWHGNIVTAAEWNAKEMEQSVWVLLGVFFLWLLHGIDAIRKPVEVFIWIVVIAIAVTQYKNVAGNISTAWGSLTGTSGQAPSLQNTGVTQNTPSGAGSTGAGP